MRLTATGKIAVLILAVGVALGVWRFWSKIAPQPAAKQTVVPKKIDLPTTSVPNTGTTSEGSQFALSGATPGCTNKPEVRLLGYAWNAQMGMLLATGGPQATTGSAMC